MECEFARRTKHQTVVASAVLERKDSGTVYDNRGAAGVVQLMLPADAVRGDRFGFRCKVAQAFRVKPPAGVSIEIAIAAGAYAAQAAGKYVEMNANGEQFNLEFDGTNWSAFAQSAAANLAVEA